MDWNLDERREALLAFTRRLVQFRAQHANLRRRKFCQDRQIRGTAEKDIAWLQPDGGEMTDEEWHSDAVRTLGVRLSGEFLDLMDESGQRVTDDTQLILLNAHPEAVGFVLPACPQGMWWEQVFDTTDPAMKLRAWAAEEVYELSGRSLSVFRQRAQAAGA